MPGFHTATLIRKAKDALAAYKDYGSNGIAIRIQGQSYSNVERGPCHGFIRNCGNRNTKAIVSLLVRTGSHERAANQCKKEVVVRYCDWLFNRSPWAVCFKYKSAANAWNEKSCVLRVDVPANLLQGALICTRNTWEYWRNINLWYTLVTEHGIDEHVAFMAVYFVSFDNTKVYPQTIGHDHVAIKTRDMTEQGIRAFLTNDPLRTTGNYNRGGDYEGVTKAWEGQGVPVFKEFTDKFNSHGKVSVVKNPFVKAKAVNTAKRCMTVAEYAMFISEFFGKYRVTHG